MELSSLGVTKAKEQQFNSKGIETVEDLIKFIPRKYYDYRTPKFCDEIQEGDNVSIIATILLSSRNVEKRYYKIHAIDDRNNQFDIFWFGNVWGLDKLIINRKYIFCGKASINAYTGRVQLNNPIFSDDITAMAKIFPVYSKIRGMSDDYLKKTMKKAIDSFLHFEPLEKSVMDKFNVVPTYVMARNIHFPRNENDIEVAKNRIVFDELFKLAFEMEMSFRDTKHPTTIKLEKMTSVAPFLKTLPFALTDGPESQLETVRGIVRKINKGFTTASLVQGDVGCGKTFVALLLMLLMAENGYQSVLMAPTNILAVQHYEDISEYLKDIPFVKTVLLTSNLKKKERDAILASIKSGEANIIIGTHSVISDSVEFTSLGLSIVDEEHRFGVVQRDKLKKKIGESVHTVTMSATPIPRSLGLSLYGEGIDIYTISKMPQGRKNVITSVSTNVNEAFDFIEKQVMDGRQAYVVCPLIEESDSERLQDVESVEETLANAQTYFAHNPNIKIAAINGKMKADEVADILSKFSKNEYNVIISTTIIEVGVNVPNSTVIVIKNAERFGLAQLHQLRGRVGRGKYQSYCILVSQQSDVPRLEVMTRTTNGFVIAEEDLKLRGMGDFIGTKQSGDVKNVMLMLANRKLYDEIRTEVKEICKSPERMNHYRNPAKVIEETVKV